MTITGRITQDAVIHQTKDGRTVVNFSIAVNDTYRPKGGEKRKATSYFSCAYWISDKVAPYLKKAVVVEVSGRVYASAYLDREGHPRASLNCHVNEIKILSSPTEPTELNHPSAAPLPGAADEADDLPF